VNCTHVGDGPGQDPDVVEAGSEREHTLGRIGALCRFEADHAAQRGGNPHRPAGVGAERETRGMLGHGQSRPRARPSWYRAYPKRIRRRAGVVVDARDAKREFVQRRRPDKHGTQASQVLDDRSIFGLGCHGGARARAGAEPEPGHGDQVLDRQRPPRERASRSGLCGACAFDVGSRADVRIGAPDVRRLRN
jgi:hypothetical protein